MCGVSSSSIVLQGSNGSSAATTPLSPQFPPQLQNGCRDHRAAAPRSTHFGMVSRQPLEFPSASVCCRARLSLLGGAASAEARHPAADDAAMEKTSNASAPRYRGRGMLERDLSCSARQTGYDGGGQGREKPHWSKWRSGTKSTAPSVRVSATTIHACFSCNRLTRAAAGALLASVHQHRTCESTTVKSPCAVWIEGGEQAATAAIVTVLLVPHLDCASGACHASGLGLQDGSLAPLRWPARSTCIRWLGCLPTAHNAACYLILTTNTQTHSLRLSS
jgi:hypothetical protein